MTEKHSFPFDRPPAKRFATCAQPGYYPGFSTLGQKKKWDEATRDVVVKRVEEVSFPFAFFRQRKRHCSTR